MPKHCSQPIPGRIEIRADASRSDTFEILIYGDIGGWDESSATAQGVAKQLEGVAASTLRVRINSYGGSVIDGLAIYNALKRHPARVEVYVDGIAASCASLIAMAGDRVEMAENALLMVHAPWGGTVGNAQDLERFVELLRRYESSMAQSYSAKSGQSVDAILALLRDYQDHWYDAREAIEAGFADAVTDAASAASAALVVSPAFSRYAASMPAHIAASWRRQTGESSMPQPTTAAPAAAASDDVLAAVRERNEEILAFASAAPGNTEVQAYVTRVIAEANPNVTSAAVGQQILRLLGKDCTPIATYGSGARANAISIGRMHRGDDFIDAASDLLVMRAGIRLDKPHPGANDIRGMSIGAIAEACLSRADRSVAASSAAAIRAALSTSDFPLILENSIRKALRNGYEVEPSSHKAWVRESTVVDFRPQSRPVLGSAPAPLKVGELGEYQYGSMSEDRSVLFNVEKYGRIVQVSWEALINDELGALGRIPQGLGQAARRVEADVIYALFTDNTNAGQSMQDGNPLFHASHANLAAASTAFDDDALAKGRLLLRKQTAVGGGFLNLEPRVLLVPADLESKAEKLIATSTVHVSTNGTSGDLRAQTPGWISGLRLVVEPRLAANAVYLIADPAQIDTVELAFLEADGMGPVVEEDEEFVRDAKSYKVRSTFGGRFLDWRGIVKVPLS